MPEETVLGGESAHQLGEVERGHGSAARAMLDKLLGHLVGEAQRKELHEVEREVFGRLMELGATLLKTFVAAKGTGVTASRVVARGEASLPYHSVKKREYFSVFGRIEIARAYFWECGAEGFCPLDAELNLPSGCYSYLLREWAELLGVEHAYEKTSAALASILGVKLPKRSVGLIARDAEEDVQPFYQARGAPAPDSEGELLIGTIDGKGVPMRRAEPRPKKLRLASGEKPNQKKEAVVTGVYTTDRHERDPEDIVREIHDDATVAAPSRPLPPRPKPHNKRVRATLAGKDAAFAELRRQLDERDPQGTKERVILTDGDEALQERALTLGQPGRAGNLIVILDIMHVLTYVWSAAYAFAPEGSAEAARWVMRKLRLLLEGKVGYVVGGLRQSLAKKHLRGSKRKALLDAIRYMHRNRDFMRYDAFIANGYPIGTGVAEGACRNLVRDRMELVGMRWTEPGAQAILDLRAVKLNGDWEAFWRYRTRQEHTRLYVAPAQQPRRKAG